MAEATREALSLPGMPGFGFESGRRFEVPHAFDGTRRQGVVDRPDVSRPRRMASDDNDREQEAFRIKFNFDRNRSEPVSVGRGVLNVLKRWWFLLALAVVNGALLGYEYVKHLVS